MSLRTIIFSILLSSINCFVCASPDEKSGPAAEIYIKGFQENFKTLPSEKRTEAIARIKEAGRRFESVLDSANYYIAERNARIDALKKRPVHSDSARFALNRELVGEYMFSSIDSAFNTGVRNLEIAEKTGDRNMVIDSRIDLSRVFVQGGYFREAGEQLDSIDIDMLDDKDRIKVLKAYFSLEFENGFFFAWNRQEHDVSAERMKSLYNALMSILPDDSYELYELKAALAFYEHRYPEAAGYYEILLLKDGNRTKWDYVNNLGGVGYNKLGSHDYVGAMDYMVRSASLAIREGMVNVPALRKIAELMFVVGDDKLASKFINKSMDNAMAYNSKYRIIESAKGYPMINRRLENHVRRDHRIIMTVAIAMAVLVILLGASLVYSRRQRRELKRQKEIISDYNGKLEMRNREIEASNEKLSETHAVTSALVSRMMKGASVRRELVEKLRKDVSLKIKVRQFDDLPGIIDNFRKEMSSQYLDLDEIILAFFPDFIEQFNRLLKEDCRVECKPGTIPTEVRIFALWRIGMKKNEDIARCMGYSLNTIKSYKTRIINSSIYEKEDFYEHLMKIKVSKESKENS